MKADDFFDGESASTDPGWDMNGEPWGSTTTLNVDLLETLRRSPAPDRDDIDVAMALTDLVHTDFERFGTGGGQRLDDDGMSLACRALRAVLGRLGVEFSLPYRNFMTFRTYWLQHGASGSWQARRDLLAEVFEPLLARLLIIEEASFNDLARAVSPHTQTGWPLVDVEIRELQRRFRSSTTPQDYRAVGTHCVGVLIALGQTVYDVEKHLRDGEVEPPPDKTKQRLGRYVEVNLVGASNEDLRGLTNKCIEFAHHVKHSQTPTRRDAGIAADAVIMLANIFRRLEHEF